MVYAYLVIVGLCLGSFVNALVWRIHDQAELRAKKKLSTEDNNQLKKLSIAKGRSMCLSCGHELQARDLVPVISWLWLRGKCRYCGARIPDTPVAELAVAAVFVLSYVAWPYALDSMWSVVYFGLWLACSVLFVALAIYDFRWFLLPDKIVLPLTILAVLAVIARSLQLGNVTSGLLGAILGALVVAGLFYSLFVVSDGNWIGGGDVKIGVALGALAGGALAGLLVILVASLLGIIATLPQLIRGHASGGTKVPFGPFLLLATTMVVLYGQSLLDWYMSLLMI